MYKVKTLMIAATLGAIVTGICAPQITHANSGGWQKDSVGWWYKDANGSYPRSEWRQINGKWYYFDRNGYIAHSKWAQINGNWYYFNNDGHMTENTWKLIDNQWYYFNTSGHMLSNQWVGDYYLGGNGAMLTSAITPDNYVVDRNGKWLPEISSNVFQNAKWRFDNSYYGYSRSKAIRDVAQAVGISEDKAALAVDAVNPNYIEQAKKAINNNYINTAGGAYSNKTIIKHLVDHYEFTREEATTALKSFNLSDVELAKLTISRRYLSDSNRNQGSFYSKACLIRQLELHDFSRIDIEKALSELAIDFSKEATFAAKYKLDSLNSKISRDQLANHLRSLQFTDQDINSALNGLRHRNLSE